MQQSKDQKSLKTGKTEKKTCANCGETGTGIYCSNCGQRHLDLRRPVSDLKEELLDTVNIDSRIFQTIIPFTFKPGFLAGEYLAGKRKKYTSPLRLYLLTSIIFFFLAQLHDNKTLLNSGDSNFKITVDSTDGVVMDEATVLELLKKDTLLLREDSLNYNNSDFRKVRREEHLRQSLIKAFTDKEFFIQALYRNLSYILFILMPVFALILKLLYTRRRLYIEHLVFSLNMHSFTLLLFSFLVIVAMVFPSASGASQWLLVVLPVYFAVGMKRFYMQGWFKTILKEIILTVLYSILLAIAFLSVLILTLFSL